MKIIPVLLIKNEEVWIRRVVTPLVNVFGNVVIADTGSTDSTIDQLAGVGNLFIIHKGSLTPQQLSYARYELQEAAKSLYGATHIFLVDGDELYPTKYLRFILNNPMAVNAMSGYTSGIEVGEKENGELWFYNAGLNRQAIISVGSIWKGVYPFESPDCYVPGHATNHYFPIPEGLHGFYHLHHTRRSTRESDVYLRTQKRDQFSMRNAPELVHETFWLNSEKDYVDE